MAAESVGAAAGGRRRPRVVVIGGGFGGMHAAQGLEHVPVDVTLVDRRNYHLFQPLLYQVALAELSPADIAQPIRSLVRDQKNVQVLMDEAMEIDTQQLRVTLKSGNELEYDYLVVATGSTHSYFGKDEWAATAPGLKTVEDAIEIRGEDFRCQFSIFLPGDAQNLRGRNDRCSRGVGVGLGRVSILRPCQDRQFVFSQAPAGARGII